MEVPSKDLIQGMFSLSVESENKITKIISLMYNGVQCRSLKQVSPDDKIENEYSSLVSNPLEMLSLIDNLFLKNICTLTPITV